MDTNPDIFYTEADSLVLCEQKAVSCKEKIIGFDKKPDSCRRGISF